jgi:TolA-binding protein
MQRTTREIIDNLLFDISDMKVSQDKLDELVNSDPYVRLILEAELEKVTIAAYVSGELSPKDTSEFENKIAKNPRLQAEVELSRKTDIYIREENLRTELDAIHKKFEIIEPSEQIRYIKNSIEKEDRNYKWILVAASVVIMFGFYLSMFSNLSHRIPLENRLYAQYYEPFAIKKEKSFLVNSSGLDEARIKYKEGDFRNAYIAFSSLPVNITIETERDFYQGLSLMEMDSYVKAIEKFNAIIETENSEWIPQAYWYKGLCVLQLRRNNEAKEVFQFIVDNRIYNFEKAAKILSSLK